jgi:hypothetical protein
MPAGGADTSRGIAFQHAQAVAACVEALEAAEVEFILVEGVEDIVDFEVCSADGRRLRVCQAKTRKEPYTWAPGDIVTTIGRWKAVPNADDARLEFLTDGSAGPELADELLPALQRARTSSLSDEDRTYLGSKGLDPEDPLLARVAVESRQPEADVVLDRVALRILRLLEIGGSQASTSRAEALVNELFRIVSVRAGKDEADERVITRDELSKLVGVPLETIDATRPWNQDAQNAYLAHLHEEPPHPSFVVLGARELQLQPAALALVVREGAEATSQAVPGPATALLDAERGGVLSGAPGAGKSTTLEVLVPEAVSRGLLPVLVSVDGYEADGLQWLIRETLERQLGYPIAPSATRDFLSATGAVLLADGAGELDSELRQSLVRDVQRLLRSHPNLRVIATSRDAARLRALGLPSFVLQGLTPGQRRDVANKLVGNDADQLVRDIEDRLSSLIESPLLFVMALGLQANGVTVANRPELFEQFVAGMAARPGGENLADVVVALIREACFELRCEDAYSADRWRWRRLLAAALRRLAELHVFDADSSSGDEALVRAEAGGLLRAVAGSGLVALTHDLFCDFFAAEAVRLNDRSLPDAVPAQLEEATVFLAERRNLSILEAIVVCTNPVAAARCVAAESEEAQVDDTDVTRLMSQLSVHLGQHRADRLASVAARTASLTDGLYVLAGADAPAPVGSPPDLALAARTARRVAKLRLGSSSLAAAVAVWIAELREALAERSPGILRQIPTDRAELPEALAKAFIERRAELQALLAGVCPGLADRVVRTVGMRGFHAVVLPVQRFTIPVGGGQEAIEHPMIFSFNASDVSVRLADAADRDFVEEPSTRIACENWLRDSAAQAALKDTIRVLSDLLPGFGP